MVLKNPSAALVMLLLAAGAGILPVHGQTMDEVQALYQYPAGVKMMEEDRADLLPLNIGAVVDRYKKINAEIKKLGKNDKKKAELEGDIACRIVLLPDQRAKAAEAKANMSKLKAAYEVAANKNKNQASSKEMDAAYKAVQKARLDIDTYEENLHQIAKVFADAVCTVTADQLRNLKSISL